MPLHAGGIEITPFAGGRFGGALTESSTNRVVDLEGSASYGLAVDVGLKNPWAFLEIVWSHQDTEVVGSLEVFELSLDSVHIGSLYRWEDRRVQPFLSGGFGLTLLDAEGTEAHLSVFLGTGFRVPLRRRTAFRFDARGIGLVDSGSGGLFCSGGCLAAVSMTGTMQGELAVGFTYSPG